MTILMGLVRQQGLRDRARARPQRGRRLPARRRGRALLAGGHGHRSCSRASLVTVLVLTGVREPIMRPIPLELKKAIAIGIGLFIAFIGLYNSGLDHEGAAPGRRSTLGSFTTWPVFATIFGLVITIVLRARGFRGDLLRRDHRDDGRSRRSSTRRPTTTPASPRGAVWPSDIVSRAELVALRRVRLPRVLDARRRLRARLGVRALPVGLLRHDGHARRRRQARRVPERGRRDADTGSRCSSTRSRRWPAARRRRRPRRRTSSRAPASRPAAARAGSSVVTGALFFPFLFLAPLIGMVPPQATAAALIIVG